ncbi:MAG: hypothetical protein WA890_18565 [Micromonospora sp.]
MSAEPTIYWNFTYRCQTCCETVQVTNGVDSHQHAADLPALVIEGCNADTPLAERVEQSLADYDLLTDTEAEL